MLLGARSWARLLEKAFNAALEARYPYIPPLVLSAIEPILMIKQMVVVMEMVMEMAVVA